MSEYLKLKVGDKVRRIHKYPIAGKRKGEVGTVKSVSTDADFADVYFLIEGSYERCTPHTDYWELVEETSPQPKPLSELTDQELVDKMNEGFAARHEAISRRKLEIEYDINDQGFWGKADVDTKHIYRLKPKPAFEPFTVGKGWRVELRGDRLHVGCKDFDAKEMRDALVCLTINGGPAHALGGVELISIRKGVWLSNSEYVLTWEDSDKILAALKKAEGGE